MLQVLNNTFSQRVNMIVQKICNTACIDSTCSLSRMSVSYGQLPHPGLCGHATELLVVCLIDIPSIPLASCSATSPSTGTPQAAVHLSSSPFPSLPVYPAPHCTRVTATPSLFPLTGARSTPISKASMVLKRRQTQCSRRRHASVFNPIWARSISTTRSCTTRSSNS